MINKTLRSEHPNQYASKESGISLTSLPVFLNRALFPGTYLRKRHIIHETPSKVHYINFGKVGDKGFSSLADNDIETGE